jgi:hypothetical protein
MSWPLRSFCPTCCLDNVPMLISSSGTRRVLLIMNERLLLAVIWSSIRGQGLPTPDDRHRVVGVDTPVLYIG